MDKANKIKLGAFILLSGTLLVGGFLAVGVLKFFESKVRCVTVLNTSVEGLSIGSAVKYLGLPVGQVTRIAMRENDGYIAVYFDIAPSAMDNGGQVLKGSANSLAEALNKRSIYCFINASGLMGGTFLELTWGGPEPPALPNLENVPADCLYVQAKPSHIGNAIQNISRVIEELSSINLIRLADKMDQALDSTNNLLGRADLADSLRQLNNISRDLEYSVKNLRSALSDQNLDKINRAINNIESSTANIMRTTSPEELGETLFNLNSFLRDTRTFVGVAQELAVKINREADPTGEKLRLALTQIANLTVQIRTLLERLDDNPDLFIRGNRQPGLQAK